MFWKFGFQNASSIDALLDQDDVSLEAILNEDDILQECKAQNTRLIDYFQRLDVLQKLFGYVSGNIRAEGSDNFRLPNVAAEVLCSEIWSIVETCLNNVDKLLVPFWDGILDKSPEDMREQITTATHFAKVNATFLLKKPVEMLAFIRAQPNVVERLLRHIETPPFVDLLLRIIQLDEYSPGAGALDWLSEEKLIPRLVALLSPYHSTSTHSIVSDLVKGIISMSAPSPGAGGSEGMQNVPASNLFARQLARRENIEKLVAFVLDDFSFEMELLNESGATSTNGSSGHKEERPSTPQSPPIPNVETAMSSATHSISVVIELIRKNNSDYFEPYLFHTLRTRLIQIQQQMHMQSQEGRVALEQAFTELVNRMGVVHLGPLLEIMCDRLERFQQLLHKPRSPSEQIPTTLGSLVPLTFERYRICELYAELLHCSNMSLLNRSSEFDYLYDSEGRLQGGLSALEDLARVIAVGSENDDQRALGIDVDEMEPAQELPISVGSAELSNIEYSDDDEDMSGEEGHGSSDDAMDEVDISGGPPGLDPPILSSEEESLQQPPLIVPSSPNATSLSSPTEIASRRSSVSRKRSTDATSPMTPSNRNKSMQSLIIGSAAKEVSKRLPVGDRLKQRFAETRVLSTLLDLFFSFPWNNFLHSVVYDVLHQILTGRVDKGYNRDLVVALFRDAHLMNRILEAQKQNDAESSKPRQVRLGYMGHLTLMSEDVIGALEHFPPDLRSLLSQYAPQPEWDEYVAGRYTETKNKDDRLLGGGKPVVAPGAARVGSKWTVDEADAVASSSSVRLVDSSSSEMKGEFKRTNRLSRETSADFGVAQPEPPDDDNIGSSPQYARYIAQAIGTSHLDEGSDDDDDDGGWLTQHRFELQPPPVSARNVTSRRPLSPRGFEDSFDPNGEPSHLFDDQFGFDDDNFGPFSDAAAVTSSDGDAGISFTTVGVDADDASFEGFGDFGEFQAADGELTPTGGSWSFASDASLSSNSSMEDVELVEGAERARREASPEETRTSIRS